MERKERFYMRGFTTFVILLSFLMLLVSGTVLYVAPKGRVANWTGWAIWGIEKEQWGSLHINIAVLFLAIAGLHLFFNWKVLLNYMRSKRSSGFRLKRELLASVGVLGLFAMGTLSEWQPFCSVGVLQDEIKAHWEARSLTAPVAHAEDLTLAEIGAYINLSGDQVINRLRERGLQVPGEHVTVEELAKANGLNPADIYTRLQMRRGAVNETATPGFGGGGGYGWMTVAALCEREGLETGVVVQKLRELGIEAGIHNNLRELANAIGTTPGKLAGDLVGKQIH